MCILQRASHHLFRLKDPLARAVILHLVPPAETHQEPARHVLDRPEVEGQQEEDSDKQLHEGVGEEEGEDEIHDQGRGAEKYVEEDGERVPVRWGGDT